MQKISANQLKNNALLLEEALREDILVTKENKPFVVIVDYNKYKNLIQKSNRNWIDETFGIMDAKESEELLQTIRENRVNKK